MLLQALIRVEGIIRKEKEMEAEEVLELMCELLHERAVRAGRRVVQDD